MNEAQHVIDLASQEVAWARERFGGHIAKPTRLAFADCEDTRIQEAVQLLAGSGFVQPVVIGSPSNISWPDEVERIGLDDPYWEPRITEAWAERDRVHSQASAQGSNAGELDPLLFMAVGVGLGLAEAGIAGTQSNSPAVIRAGIRGLGATVGGGLVSGAFLVSVGEALWTWADCSVVPDPDADQLAKIAFEAATLHQLVSGDQARVALLSFSTAGSAEHAVVTKVRCALATLQRDYPELDADGEMQFDAAIDLGIGVKKFPGSAVAGKANVFVFPDLNAGNIAYKVVQRIGHARIMGSFVLGLSRPWVDLSRGCTTAEIVSSALALCATVSSRHDTVNARHDDKEVVHNEDAAQHR
jgi:phosphotransacetylase